MAGISDRRHNDNRVMCLRIFADASGETHMEDFEIAFQPRKLFEDNPPLRLSDNFPTSWCNICHVPSGMGEVDWHNPPQRLLVLWLSGEVEFETSDGDVRRLPAGSIVLAEDTSGKGHISVTLLKASWWCMSPLPTTRVLREALPVPDDCRWYAYRQNVRALLLCPCGAGVAPKRTRHDICSGIGSRGDERVCDIVR
jgi:hypothetical protein